MYEEETAAIQILIALGKKAQARKILKRMLEEHPTADLWVLAATASERSEQEIGCWRQALKLDPQHREARERYNQLVGGKRETQEMQMPPLMALVDDLPMIEPLISFEPIKDVFAYKREQRERVRQRWTYLGCLGYALLSLSSAYFALTVLGSPLPGQIRTLLSGGAAVAPEATVVFGRATEGAPANPVAGATENYSAEAAAAGLEVKPTKSERLQADKPTGDVLDPGFFHEYTFTVQRGSEVVIGVQFFSPTATKVPANAAVLDADGYNAGAKCQRDAILTDGSSVAFTCQIDQSGTWKLQLFGRSGESTGVYAVTYQTF